MSAETDRTRVELAAARLLSIYEGPAWHGPSVLEALAGVDANSAAAHRVDGAHNIGELVAHIAVWNDIMRGALEGKTIGRPTDAEDFIPFPDSADDAEWQRRLEHLRSSVHGAHAAIGEFPLKRLRDTVPGRDYNFFLLIEALPDHLTYHAGQISLLKKH